MIINQTIVDTGIQGIRKPVTFYQSTWEDGTVSYSVAHSSGVSDFGQDIKAANDLFIKLISEA
jgi:hypothetical protein